MINLMRKNQRWLMLLVSIIVIVAFVFLYNKTDLDQIGKSAVGSIYGRAVSGSEFARSEKQFEIARGLGMFELLQVLATGGGRDQAEDYVWNTLVLQKKAGDLQIEPDADAISARIQSLPPFQKEGQFDYEQYQAFVANALTPRGFSEGQLNDLIRDDLRLSRLRDLVGSSMVTIEGEVREAYGNAFRKRHLQLIKLQRATFEAAATPTPDEIKAYFDKNQASLTSDEKRVAQYVALVLNEEQKKLTGKEKVAALQPLSNLAEDFSQRLLKPGADFSAIANELKVAVKETAPFTDAAPPVELAGVAQAGPTVFSLSKDIPDSDVLQTEEGFYLFHLTRVDAAVPQTLEEATPKITTVLKEEKIAAAMTARAAEIQKALQAALKEKKTFAQAAEAAGLKPETLPPYSPAELQQSQEMNAERVVQMRAAGLSEGAVTDLIPTMEGGAIAYLEKMDPLDEEKWKGDRETILDRYSSSRREMTFSEWFRAQRAAANIRIGTAG